MPPLDMFALRAKAQGDPNRFAGESDSSWLLGFLAVKKTSPAPSRATEVLRSLRRR
jgi:hypothetical protein